MAFTEMALPVDIPWKRMGFSKDMMDAKKGDFVFPERWRSSLSLFYHEPGDLPPEYCDRRITYLKVVATVSSYQVGEEEVTVLDQMTKKYQDFYAWKEFSSRVTDAYPCYGALLQVAVFPNPDGDVPIHDYPYVTAMQPRKREMYEVVSESGELASNR